MVVLGGFTRLTRSGLSMTDWKFTGGLGVNFTVKFNGRTNHMQACLDGVLDHHSGLAAQHNTCYLV
jgi:hypothetical protein